MKPLNALNLLFSATASGMLLWGAVLANQHGFTPITHANPIVENQFPSRVALDETAITAKAAIVYDPTTKKILFAKNADMTLPLASLTKLMAAHTALMLQNEKKIISIKNRDLEADGDWGLQPGESWSIGQLLSLGLVASSNDAIAAVAGASGPEFIDSMNNAAKEMGLTQSYFSNPTGLDVDQETAGAYGSAQDVALLTSAFLKSNAELFEKTTHPSVSIRNENAILTATSTDLPILSIPGLVGAKTGYTDLAGGNLVAAFDIEIGHPVVIVVLGSTLSGRFEDVQRLIEAVRRAEH